MKNVNIYFCVHYVKMNMKITVLTVTITNFGETPVGINKCLIIKTRWHHISIREIYACMRRMSLSQFTAELSAIKMST